MLRAEERRREEEGCRRRRGCSLLLSFEVEVRRGRVAAVVAVDRERGRVAGTAAVAGRREVGRKKLAEVGKEDWDRTLLPEGTGVLGIPPVVGPAFGWPRVVAEELPKLVGQAAFPSPRARRRWRWRGWTEVVG